MIWKFVKNFLGQSDCRVLKKTKRNLKKDVVSQRDILYADRDSAKVNGDFNNFGS